MRMLVAVVCYLVACIAELLYIVCILIGKFARNKECSLRIGFGKYRDQLVGVAVSPRTVKRNADFVVGAFYIIYRQLYVFLTGVYRRKYGEYTYSDAGNQH